MISLKIEHKRKELLYNFPSKWEELSEKQIIKIFKAQAKSKNKFQQNLATLKILFPKLLKKIAVLSKQQQSDCIRLLSTQLNTLKQFAIYKPITILKKNGKGKYMQDITFREWADCDLQFWLFEKTKNKEHLFTLCAIVYSLPIEKIRRLKPYFIDYILFYYLSSKMYLIKFYSECEHPLFKLDEGKGQATKPHNYEEDMFSLMADGAYKSKKEIETAKITEIFEYLIFKDKKNEALKQHLTKK